LQQHKQLERALLIGRIAPFTSLSLDSRFILAGATVKRSYAPGATIVAAGEALDEVMIPVAGTVLHQGSACTGTFDVPAVLMSRPASHAYLAGEQGCSGLALTKSHMYTLLRECPRIVENYLQPAEARP
jgi:hypothetical protein